MKRVVWLWQLMGFAVTSFLGTVLHFLYDWSGKALWIAPFSGVNESTWEHMKLLFWPMLLYAIVQSFFFRGHAGFFSIKLRGTALGLLLIPILFYGYNGVIGKSPDWINIAIFFISAAAAYGYEAHLLHRDRERKRPWLALSLLCLIAVAFVLFTFKTPEIGIFRDPLSGIYGLG